jgi:hypothetical protein
MTFDEYVISVEKIVDKLLRLSQSLADMVKDANSKNKKMKSLLERLAPEDGNYQFDDFSNDPSYCIQCGANEGEDHKPDCIWLEVRKLLEELK